MLMKLFLTLSMWTFFGRKPRVIPTFGIRIKESLEELDFDPDIIAKFELPETPPYGHIQLLWSTSLFHIPRTIKRILQNS